MSSTATIRELRSEGEVLVTGRRKPRYRLTLYAPRQEPWSPAVDYWERLKSYLARSMTRAQSRKLRGEDRGEH